MCGRFLNAAKPALYFVQWRHLTNRFKQSHSRCLLPSFGTSFAQGRECTEAASSRFHGQIHWTLTARNIRNSFRQSRISKQAPLNWNSTAMMCAEHFVERRHYDFRSRHSPPGDCQRNSCTLESNKTKSSDKLVRDLKGSAPQFERFDKTFWRKTFWRQTNELWL